MYNLGVVLRQVENEEYLHFQNPNRYRNDGTMIGFGVWNGIAVKNLVLL